MPEQLLDRPQIRPALQHVRGTRVAERVRVQVRAGGAQLSVAAHQLLDAAHTQA